MKSASLLLSAALLLAAGSAQAQIFRCTDTEGNTVISNVQQGKNCKKVATDPVSTLPAPPKPSASAPRTPSPAGFPRVDDATQKSRDGDRRRILEQELASEQKSLEEARKELAEQEGIRNGDERNYQKVLDRLQPYKDKVQLHERNIEAIRKETANLR